MTTMMTTTTMTTTTTTTANIAASMSNISCENHDISVSCVMAGTHDDLNAVGMENESGNMKLRSGNLNIAINT